ncbi:hypothetical protein [Labedaea rhizosphaerae]|uniref:hypothetical protein n=1 Tax=Labedaea rhizosphaerae TaxID=598644 RepID=UPI0010610560|nr:hypothetical protein [Labedaea rhizosphaerae]
MVPPKGPDTEDEPSERRPKLLFTRRQLGITVLLVLTYWIMVFILPEHRLDEAWPIQTLAYLGAAIVMVISSAAMRQGGKWRAPEILAIPAFVLFLDGLLVLGLTGVVHFVPELKFAMAVGGGAIAAFLLGIVIFDTVRVAASLPIVVLFIGMVTYPVEIAGFADNRSQVIIWMGVILGVSAAAEGATQTAKVIGRAQITKAMIADKSTPTPDLGKTLSAYADDTSGDLVASHLKSVAQEN